MDLVIKKMLLYAEKEYGMCYSIAGANSGKKKSHLQVLCFCCCMEAVHEQTPAFLVLSESTRRSVLWCLHLLKKYLPLWVSNLSLKSSKEPF